MTFETMDWNAELKRVVAAFDVVEECAFDLTCDSDSDLDEFMWLCPLTFPPRDRPKTEYGTISAAYYRDEFSYVIWMDTGDSSVELSFDWPMKAIKAYIGSDRTGEASSLMAKALFHLDLLTHKVEAHLQVSISEHQKLEWTLEYNQRFNP